MAKTNKTETEQASLQELRERQDRLETRIKQIAEYLSRLDDEYPVSADVWKILAQIEQ